MFAVVQNIHELSLVLDRFRFKGTGVLGITEMTDNRSDGDFAVDREALDT